MNNYAVINGIRVELTDEQVKTLGIEKKVTTRHTHLTTSQTVSVVRANAELL